MKEKPRARVLLVESECYFLEMLVMHLEANFDVAIQMVTNDEEAIAAMGTGQRFDLIVTGRGAADAKLLRYLSDNGVATPSVIFASDASERRPGTTCVVAKPNAQELVRAVTPFLRSAAPSSTR